MLGKNRHHYGTDGRDSQANHHQPHMLGCNSRTCPFI
uniref:Uncharacterized protein n=1 Tax=Siphoviridae sp. ctBCr48 TaxID=2827802 RepID=A0A8S5SI05_9CAUD|nr:MAG TPA: hypothetical protein [Siphoviridae sp. ctBCr48]